MNQPSMSLSEMLGLVKQAVSMMFKDGLWLTAEILQVSGTRHTYLELVEYDDARREKAKVSGKIWSSNQKILTKFQKATGSQLSSGMKILFRAVPEYHEIYGLSLTLSDIDPTYSIGEMEKRLNEIRQMLREKGWWDLNRLLETPREFCRIAVISPPDAAGLGDFRVHADKLQSFGLCDFEYFPAAFQGPTASTQIVDQMVAVLARHKVEAFDFVAMIRGGGDKAGLYQLNDRRLAAACCRLPIPIMVAIGHERDSVILDEVANVRFPTPSMLIAHVRETIIGNARTALANWERISRLSQKLLQQADHLCDQQSRLLKSEASRQLDRADGLLAQKVSDNQYAAQSALDRAEKGLVRVQQQFGRSAEGLCGQAEEEIIASRGQMFRQAEMCLQTAQADLEHHVTEVVSANPLSIMRRGYAYVKSGTKFVKSSGDVTEGDTIQVNLSEGSIMATVQGAANVQ